MEPCFAVTALIVVLAYAVPLTRMIILLIHLLRQPGRIAQFGLGTSCVIRLCYLPALMLLFAAMLIAINAYITPFPSHNTLATLMSAPFAAIITLVAWLVMTLWFRHIVRRELGIYLVPTALVPVVIMALLCLTNVVLVTSHIVSAVMPPSSLSGGWPPAVWDWLMAGLLLYIPAAPLIGFVLLIIHVSQVRSAKTWEILDIERQDAEADQDADEEYEDHEPPHQPEEQIP